MVVVVGLSMLVWVIDWKDSTPKSYNVLMGTLNPTHSLTQQNVIYKMPLIDCCKWQEEYGEVCYAGIAVVTVVGMYGQTANGHTAAAERYGTRCATGVIQRKRYDRVFTDDDDDDEDNDGASRSRGAFLRSRRNRPEAASESDSDTERQQRVVRSPTKSSSGILPSLSSSRHHSRESEDDSSDSENTINASNANTQSSSKSGSDTEAYSEGSGPVKSARMTRSTSGKPVITNGHFKRQYGGGIGAMYRTRNQGRRTVHYEEADSDVDWEGKEGRWRVERRRTELGSRARLC